MRVFNSSSFYSYRCLHTEGKEPRPDFLFFLFKSLILYLESNFTERREIRKPQFPYASLHTKKTSCYMIVYNTDHDG